jgi:hypothetical protein
VRPARHCEPTSPPLIRLFFGVTDEALIHRYQNQYGILIFASFSACPHHASWSSIDLTAVSQLSEFFGHFPPKRRRP